MLCNGSDVLSTRTTMYYNVTLCYGHHVATPTQVLHLNPHRDVGSRYTLPTSTVVEHLWVLEIRTAGLVHLLGLLSCRETGSS